MSSSTDLASAHVEWPAGQRLDRDETDQSALERSDVVGDAVGDEVEDDRIVEVDVVERDPLAQDRDAGGVVRCGELRHESRLEAVPEALLDREQSVRDAIAGEDELMAGVVDGVEGVEELLLGLRLAREELDVVDQQNVDVAVARA